METESEPFRQPIVIATKATEEGQKSRCFGAELLCLIVANGLWSPGSTAKDRTFRPLFLAYAGTDQESRAFSENLRLGHPALCESSSASTSGFRLEIPRSAGFRFETHRQPEGTLTLAYLPSALSLLPDSSDDRLIRFLLLPPTWWVEREAAALSELGSDAREAAIAAYWVAYLDQRSPLPIANHPRFHLALYRAARDTSWCHGPDGSAYRLHNLFAEGYRSLGFEPPLIVSTTSLEFSAFLAEQTSRHLPQIQKESPNGPTRIRSPRRLLPIPDRPAPEARVARGARA